MVNYTTTLPDFIEMQRISFCWFITQGLNEELALFSKIQDFSQNTEYIMFSEEYSLIKPPYSLLIARKTLLALSKHLGSIRIKLDNISLIAFIEIYVSKQIGRAHV